MVEFDNPQIGRLQVCIGSLEQNFRTTVAVPLGRTLELVPAHVKEFLGLLSTANQELQNAPGGKTKSVADTILPLLKRALMFQLRKMSESIEARRLLTPDGPMMDQLDATLLPYEQLANCDWFLNTSPVHPPVLTDFLVISKVEEILGQTISLAVRESDEKFRILTAPQLFLPDLAYYRFQCCELRRRPVSVAYMDIDKFKQFNTDLGEPRVDRDVLPIFMRVLERRSYGHGHVYRYGGDEYVVLLPNRGATEAVKFLATMQDALSQEDYKEIKHGPTISIGVCEVTNDSVLTDRQLMDWAAKAKQFAKDKGRNRIAGFAGTAPSRDNLVVLHPK